MTNRSGGRSGSSYERSRVRIRERFRIRGDVFDAIFVPWIGRHGSRLGLECSTPQIAADAIEFEAAGHPDLLDAMELGCSLGPIEVRVEAVERFVLSPAE